MTCVVADIGASNARFAYIRKGRLSDIFMFPCDDFKTPVAMIESFVKGYASEAQTVILGVAGVILKNRACWTNRSWILDIKKLKKKLGLKNLIVMNDVELQGYALNRLSKKDLSFIQQHKLGPGPKILMSVGTGLGVCYLINKQIYSAEYGQTLLESGLPIETLISGHTLKCLQQEMKSVHSATQLFYNRLASIAMNLALSLKATGGIYLYGGMLEEQAFRQFDFTKKFNHHPKMQAFLKTVPIVFIQRKYLAFLAFRELAKKFD